MLRNVLSIGFVCALLNAAPASAVEMNEISGSCTKFVMRHSNLTRTCKPLILNNIHQNGRIAFLYASQGKAMSFVGNRANVRYDGVFYTLPLDQVVVSDGAWPRPINGNGTCRYGTPKQGEAYPVACEINTSEGNFSAALIADAGNIRYNPVHRNSSLESRAIANASADAVRLPISGSYGQVNGQGNPCNDAKLEREGDYITFGPNKFFHGEFWRPIAAARSNGNGWFDVSIRKPNKTLSSARMYVDPYMVRYDGAIFRRCT
ncbi:hypothetical protein [Methylobacterium fujisawaense]|jgi:hypothetical protein